MEISIVILSCVILGLNPEMPVFIRLIMICNLNGFRQIKYIHTYIGSIGAVFTAESLIEHCQVVRSVNSAI